MTKPLPTMAKAKQAFDILRHEGWSKEQACGIIANIEAESNFQPEAVGDHGTAYGLCQWHLSRQKAFAGHFGHDIRSASYDEQVQFITYELKGTERHAGELLKKATSAKEAGWLVSHNYERPSDNEGAVAQHRAERADVWFGLL